MLFTVIGVGTCGEIIEKNLIEDDHHYQYVSFEDIFDEDMTKWNDELDKMISELYFRFNEMVVIATGMNYPADEEIAVRLARLAKANGKVTICVLGREGKNYADIVANCDTVFVYQGIPSGSAKSLEQMVSIAVRRLAERFYYKTDSSLSTTPITSALRGKYRFGIGESTSISAATMQATEGLKGENYLFHFFVPIELALPRLEEEVREAAHKVNQNAKFSIGLSFTRKKGRIPAFSPNKSLVKTIQVFACTSG